MTLLNLQETDLVRVEMDENVRIMRGRVCRAENGLCALIWYNKT